MRRTMKPLGALAATTIAAILFASPTNGPAQPSTGAGPDSLESIVQEVTPAVVLINVETPTGSRQGSGFLVSADGLILTNQHVVQNATSARVKLASGDVYRRVTVLAADDRRDIAVLRIPGFALPSLPMGNSDSVAIGTNVVAVGSPLGLENTVSTGIISGRRQESEGYQLLQITAPASVGSSGGPVLTRNGQVVGIAGSQLQAGQNLNFAVPINYARGLMSHMSGEPVAELAPSPSGGNSRTSALASGSQLVNAELRFDMSGFQGYRLELSGMNGTEGTRRTEITYRRLVGLGPGRERVERYVESETTGPSGSFGGRQTLRRTRSRAVAEAGSLTPVSARGEVAWWTETGWKTLEYDLRFESGSVRGTIRDTTGQIEQVDREIPRGVLLHGMRNLAFGVLETDSLLGRSVELVTFDPRRGEITRDRYDVRSDTTVQIADREFEALRVEIATGLTTTRALFRTDRPRILLGQDSSDDGWSLELRRLEFFDGPRSGASERRSGSPRH